MEVEHRGEDRVYFGEIQTSLDEKGRITVPRRFRELMDVAGHIQWYATRGFDRAIFLFHREEWEKIRAQVSRYSSMNAPAIDFRRLFFGSVTEVRSDRQGRMAIPSYLRDHAGLEKEAVLIGVDDHLELWSRDAWRAFQKNKEAEFKEMAGRLFAGGDDPAAATEKGETDHEH